MVIKSKKTKKESDNCYANESKNCTVEENCEQEGDKPIDLSLSDSDKQRLTESLTACKMIKNVIRTKMEMHKKQSSLAVKKCVKKLLIKGKQRIAGMCRRGCKENKLVIDLNVNFKLEK